MAIDGGWTREDLRYPRIPRSVHDAVQRRLMALSVPARDVFTLAAVAGRQFDFDLLQSISGHDEAALLDLMKDLVAARLVVEETGDRFVFRHALTREAIYAGLLERERRLLHRGIADAIERLYGSSPDARLDDLAAHFFAAGAWPQALEAARGAGARPLTFTLLAPLPSSSRAQLAPLVLWVFPRMRRSTGSEAAPLKPWATLTVLWPTTDLRSTRRAPLETIMVNGGFSSISYYCGRRGTMPRRADLPR